ncbi:GlcG/HbpS family heme-binding protein [Nitrospira sp. M1]
MNGAECQRPTVYSSCMNILLMTCCVIGLVTAQSSAEELPRESVLPLSLATKAAHAAVDKCLADGYRVSATVVDRGGNIRAVLRQDGAGPHTLESSRKKAYSSASLKQPTEKLAGLVAKMPVLHGLQHMNEHILLLAGGLPIELGDEVVGGIGVGGAPGGHLDVACAQAGLRSIGAASKSGAQKSEH